MSPRMEEMIVRRAIRLDKDGKTTEQLSEMLDGMKGQDPIWRAAISRVIKARGVYARAILGAES